jgi:hypothetical protein
VSQKVATNPIPSFEAELVQCENILLH